MIIVYSYYVLDIVHKGHLLYMKNAKAIAGKDGKSIVGILTDEAVMEKAFGHLEATRVGQESEDTYLSTDVPKLIANGGLWRLGEEDDEPVTFIEVWTNEVKFVPPKGTVQ